MGNLTDLLLLCALGAMIACWVKLARARELVGMEVRRQCERHGLQLLDETVGLRALRLTRRDGQRALERGYDFEVSIDGDDREAGRIWMRGDAISAIVLPTVRSGDPGAIRLPRIDPPASNNVVDLLARIRDRRDF